MKAIVKATGRKIEVMNVMDINGQQYWEEIQTFSTEPIQYKTEELDFVDLPKVKQLSEPDYWEKLKHQYAGMAMQAYIIGNQINPFGFSESPKDMEMCVSMATALVNKLKEEQK